MRIFNAVLLWTGGFLILFGCLVTLGFIKLPSIITDQVATLKESSQSISPTPKVEQKISFAQIDQSCKLTIVSDKGSLTFPTNFDSAVAKCGQYSLTKLSNSGQYVALEDLSADGVDSLIKIFSYQLQKITLLHDLDQYSILDFIFLPNDQLAVLISLGFKGEQKVYVYNLKYLFDQYLEEAQNGEFSNQAIKLATGELPIPKGSKRAATLRLDEQKLLVFDETNKEPMLSFSLDSL